MQELVQVNPEAVGADANAAEGDLTRRGAGAEQAGGHEAGGDARREYTGEPRTEEGAARGGAGHREKGGVRRRSSA